MSPHSILISAPIDAASPEQLAWVVRFLVLLSVAFVALFLGWLIVRWMRLRYVRMTAATGTVTCQSDAWSEAARRMAPDDDTVDLDPPPDQPPPPRGPDPRWQS